MTSIFEQQQTEPKRTTRIRLKSMADLRKFAGRAIREAYAGDITATQARAISTLLETARRLTEASQLEERVKALEGCASGSGPSDDDLGALRGRIAMQMAQVEVEAWEENEDRELLALVETRMQGDGNADTGAAHCED